MARSLFPEDRTLRTMNCARLSANSITSPELSRRTEVECPHARARSRGSSRIGAPKVAPASDENAAYACPSSPFAVNHAIATVRPSALNAGPLTGRRQCASRRCEQAQASSTCRPRGEIQMSRISSGLRSRNATIASMSPRPRSDSTRRRARRPAFQRFASLVIKRRAATLISPLPCPS